ncbi:TPA: endonuclease V, partial [Candidatus Bathyarchaeota archaeon]|nr:endonuclease V [Candidatus Bathyarchaeota archaeon]
EMETKVQKTMFPYIPTLLSFREIPPAVSAIRKLKIKPDVYLVDGHGRAHPYKCGFASHLGLVIDAPTIGVAKKILCGEVHKRLGANWNPLVLDGEIIGAEVYTKEGSKPVYVSIGHMVSLDTAIRIVLQCSMDHRIPKPILEAHRAANQERERLKSLLI